MMTKNPLFIVVDGGDGSGKDTQAKLIAKYYLDRGSKVRIRSHPCNDNFAGRKAKKALIEGGKKGHLKAAIFYSIDVIRSLIRYYRHEDEVIIFVRYLLGVCYLPSRLVAFGYNFFASILPTTKYSYYIDVSAEEANRRVSQRGESTEMFESIKALRKMRRKMCYITKMNDWIIIDGNRSVKEVWEQIKNTLPSK